MNNNLSGILAAVWSAKDVGFQFGGAIFAHSATADGWIVRNCDNTVPQKEDKVREMKRVNLFCTSESEP